MAQSNLGGFGYNEVITKTSAYTVVQADSGTIINVTATATITLPSTVIGYSPIIRVGADGITVTVQPASVDYIAGAQFTNVDNKALVFTNSPVGSYVALVADGTNGWVIQSLNAGGASSTVTKTP